VCDSSVQAVAEHLGQASGFTAGLYAGARDLAMRIWRSDPREGRGGLFTPRYSCREEEDQMA
jgi:hypothetical protein